MNVFSNIIETARLQRLTAFRCQKQSLILNTSVREIHIQFTNKGQGLEKGSMKIHGLFS